jgi:hypothetical protein
VRALLMVLYASIVFAAASFAYEIKLSNEEIAWIGERIFANECSSRDNLLVQWNKGEDFLSLGIAHFIWYPKDKKGPFQEAFPDFLRFAKVLNLDMPAWLEADISQHCPWQSREEFFSSQSDNRLLALRDFLKNTKSLQAEFIVKRFDSSLSLMLENISDITQKHRVKRQLERLFSTAKGTYALIDYANFKGMGVLPSERYEGRGWGLLQVLSDMQDEHTAPDATSEFARSADNVLTERVRNSPGDRNEQRWLAGWRNRINTYINP